MQRFVTSSLDLHDLHIGSHKKGGIIMLLIESDFVLARLPVRGPLYWAEAFEVSCSGRWPNTDMLLSQNNYEIT